MENTMETTIMGYIIFSYHTTNMWYKGPLGGFEGYG